MRLTEIIKDSFSVKNEDQKDEVVFNSLDQWDSMSHMLFITRIEDNFEMQFTGEEIMSMHSIGDLKKILQKKGIENI